MWYIVFSGLIFLASSHAQLLNNRISDPIKTEILDMYRKGVEHLIKTQNPKGDWSENMGQEPAVIGFAMLSVLASGKHYEEPDEMQMVERCLEAIMEQQDIESGYIGDSMYNHGFATLALAEAYGEIQQAGLANALQRAVTLIVNAQDANPKRAWRYTPTSVDADSTVTGCQIAALLDRQSVG